MKALGNYQPLIEDPSYSQVFFNPKMRLWHTYVNILKSVMDGRLLDFSSYFEIGSRQC